MNTTSTETTSLNLAPEDLIRVYVDITRDLERKFRARLLSLELEHGRKFTRKDYLEKLIADDLAQVKGASLREVSQRKSK